MDKNYKYLLKNVGVLTISNFASRLLNFFLIPLYTAILTTKDYGIYDIVSNTVSLLLPVLTLNIYDSVLRYSLDYDTDKKRIFTIGLKYVLVGTGILVILIFLNHILSLYEVFDEYSWALFSLYISFAIFNIISNFVRGIDRIQDIAVSGVIGSVVLISLTLIFLIPCNMGLVGYFWAAIGGNVSQIIYLALRVHITDFIQFRTNEVRGNSDKLEIEMRNYSVPMIANNVAWWVNNVMDRYIVTAFCGMAENGIYAIGAKIPSILGVLQAIFSQAWTLSAVKEFDPEDKNGFFSQTYDLYAFVNMVGCSILIMFDRPLALLLYANEFYDAWRYVPFLTIAAVSGALIGYIGGIFSAAKDTKVFAHSSIVGALLNFSLNMLLVRQIGALGAAIATAISYWAVWGIRLIMVKKYITLRIKTWRECLSFIILSLQSIVLLVLIEESLRFYIIQCIAVASITYLYKKELRLTYESLLIRFRR